VTGPVGWTISRGAFGWRGVSSRRWRESWRGRAAPLSITTRRFRPEPGAPWRGLIGLLGLLGPFPFAIRWISVEARECRIDPHRALQGSIERPPGLRPLEAG
jgi:hypothetical protein